MLLHLPLSCVPPCVFLRWLICFGRVLSYLHWFVAYVWLPSATRVVVLTNMVTVSELEDDDEFDDIVADVREECTRFGVVKSVTIPRKGHGVGRVRVSTRCCGLPPLPPSQPHPLAPHAPLGPHHACPWRTRRLLCPLLALLAARRSLGFAGPDSRSIIPCLVVLCVYVCTCRRVPRTLQVFVEFDNIAQAITASASLNGRLFAQRRVGTEYMNEFTYAAQDFSAFP